MWTLTNHSPFSAERAWVRDRAGAEVWLVAVRATFLIGADGSTTVAPEQEPVCIVPRYRDDPVSSSLVYESDLVQTKPGTDVVAHAHAYAPGARPATAVDVGLRVAGIEKALRVVGDRTWVDSPVGVVASDPAPFVVMPITYERAYGGVDPFMETRLEPRNPVGVGFASRSEHLLGRPVPNVENSNQVRRTRPAGFGPIPGHWAPRAGYAGTYDQRWEEERLPLLPEDFDDRFYRCAPEDQQIPGFLQGGEVVEMYNLTPSGYLSFRVPTVRLRFETSFTDGEVRVHAPTLHTLILEPDVPRVLAVWHTSLPCHPKVLRLENTDIRLERQPQERRTPANGGSPLFPRR